MKSAQPSPARCHQQLCVHGRGCAPCAPGNSAHLSALQGQGLNRELELLSCEIQPCRRDPQHRELLGGTPSVPKLLLLDGFCPRSRREGLTVTFLVTGARFSAATAGAVSISLPSQLRFKKLALPFSRKHGFLWKCQVKWGKIIVFKVFCTLNKPLLAP